MSKPIIQLENISKYYTGAGGVGLGLRKVNCSFSLGEFVIITGPSGSGKTTLLNVISGMDTYEEGILYINGEDSTYFGPKEYEEYRRNYISFIFQNYKLVDSFTVYQNVELALIARGLSKTERQDKVLQIIDEVGLSHRKKHRVTQLSGGEKQRVAIARELASDAPIMVCDEITGNLDKKTSEEIIALLRKVSYNKLVLLVSHDIEEAIMHATRVITMHDGMIKAMWKRAKTSKRYRFDHSRIQIGGDQNRCRFGYPLFVFHAEKVGVVAVYIYGTQYPFGLCLFALCFQRFQLRRRLLGRCQPFLLLSRSNRG